MIEINKKRKNVKVESRKSYFVLFCFDFPITIITFHYGCLLAGWCVYGWMDGFFLLKKIRLFERNPDNWKYTDRKNIVIQFGFWFSIVIKFIQKKGHFKGDKKRENLSENKRCKNTFFSRFSFDSGFCWYFSKIFHHVLHSTLQMNISSSSSKAFNDFKDNKRKIWPFFRWKNRIIIVIRKKGREAQIEQQQQHFNFCSMVLLLFKFWKTASKKKRENNEKQRKMKFFNGKILCFLYFLNVKIMFVYQTTEKKKLSINKVHYLLFGFGFFLLNEIKQKAKIKNQKIYF